MILSTTRTEPPVFHGTTIRIPLKPGVEDDPLRYADPPIGILVPVHGATLPPIPPAGAGAGPPAGAPTAAPPRGAPPAASPPTPSTPAPPPPGAPPASASPPTPSTGAAPPLGAPAAAAPPRGAHTAASPPTPSTPAPPPPGAPPASASPPTPSTGVAPPLGAPAAAASPPAAHTAVAASPSAPSTRAVPPPGAPPAVYQNSGPTVLSCLQLGTPAEDSPPFDASSVMFGCVSQHLLDPGRYLPLLGSSANKEPQLISDIAGPSTPPPVPPTNANGKKKKKPAGGRSRSPSPEPTKSTSTPENNAWLGMSFHDVIWSNTPEINKHKQDLRAYMEEFCPEAAEQLWQNHSYHIKIDFEDLKRKNKKLAYFIANNFKKFQSSIKVVAQNFLRDRFQNKPDDGRFGHQTLNDQVKNFTILTFKGIPNRITSLEDFIKQNKSEPTLLFKGHPESQHTVIKVKPALRRIIQKMVVYITSAHTERKETWDGKWTLADWEVIDDSDVRLCKDPIKLLNKEMGFCDLASVSTEVIPKLADDTFGEYPAYFEHLADELRNPDVGNLSETDIHGWYYMYLTYHPALMSSKARSTLLYAFYFTSVRLNCNQMECYNLIFKDTSFGDWTNFVYEAWGNVPEVQWRVFWHGHYPKAGTHFNDWKLPFKNNVPDFLNKVRHLLQHANRHTIWNDTQMMLSSTEPELLAADIYKSFLPNFIKLLFQHKAMEGENDFHADWDFYTQSTSYRGV